MEDRRVKKHFQIWSPDLRAGDLAWHEGVTYERAERDRIILDLFDMRSGYYWTMARSYVLFDPYYRSYWCVTAKFISELKERERRRELVN